MKQHARHEIRELTTVDVEQQIREFEARYGMTSEEFYRRYEAGEIGDSGVSEDQDFMIWAALHEWQVDRTHTNAD